VADEAAIRSARLSHYCTIQAPITGYAGKIQLRKGNLVKANDTTPLVVMNQVAPIDGSFSVPEQSFPPFASFRRPPSGTTPTPDAVHYARGLHLFRSNSPAGRRAPSWRRGAVGRARGSIDVIEQREMSTEPT